MVTTVLTAWLLAWGLLPEQPSEPAATPQTSSSGPTEPAATPQTSISGPMAEPSPSGGEVPFTVAVALDYEMSDGWIIDAPPAQVPPRPDNNGDWHAWAERAKARRASIQTVRFTVQGRSEAQVTLTNLRVRVVTRRPAIEGTLFRPTIGGTTAYRWVLAELDRDPPVLKDEVDEDMAEDVPAYERKPIRFPYRVALSDAETFLVEGHTQNCDCDWVIDLSWASQGRTGTTTVDNGGKPFRVTGSGNVRLVCQTGRSETCTPPR